MSNSICMISTPDYLAQTLASLNTAKKYGGNADCHILVVTTKDISVQAAIFAKRGIHLSNLLSVPAAPVTGKYSGDQLRWALKPYFLKHLLRKYKNIVYLDNDLLFLSDWSWLWRDIETHDFTLTPQRRTLFSTNTWTDGTFNAGFVGVSRGGYHGLTMWAELCQWKCEVNHKEGLFVDQKYLDMIPTMCRCKIVDHPGCNVAGWNVLANPLVAGKVGGKPIVFMHLSPRADRYYVLMPYEEMFAALIEQERKFLANEGLLIRS
jgi:hypothetical protein